MNDRGAMKTKTAVTTLASKAVSVESSQASRAKSGVVIRQCGIEDDAYSYLASLQATLILLSSQILDPSGKSRFFLVVNSEGRFLLSGSGR